VEPSRSRDGIVTAAAPSEATLSHSVSPQSEPLSLTKLALADAKAEMEFCES